MGQCLIEVFQFIHVLTLKISMIYIFCILLTLSLNLYFILNVDLWGRSEDPSSPVSPVLRPSCFPFFSAAGLRSAGAIKGLSPLELMEHRTCALPYTHTATRDKPSNLRQRYLEIWDRVLRVLKNVTVRTESGGVSLLKISEICVKRCNGNRRPALKSLSP